MTEETTAETTSTESAPSNFVRAIIDEHNASGRYGGQVVTRFPPEPNGFLHIGHAKAICLNFGVAADYGGRCHLRFDDTNPTKEDQVYVDAIQRDIRWLGFDWGEHLYYASDYFPRFYELAVKLIEDGKAYVDEQSREEIRAQRGTLTEPGTASPYRDRPAAESLALLEQMRRGELPEGAAVLRAKIDMANPNMLMRDPLLYRILRHPHDRSGDAWNIYPMYDFAHCISDAIEGVTHSLCSLEFENNRELYDWVLDHTGFAEPRPHQYEFARLKLDYTVMSKRKFLQLIAEGHVDGWDDPRMPTLAGYRRCGVRPEAIRAFAEMVGVAKTNSVVDIGKLEYCIREDLNTVAPRVMCVLDPLEVVLTNYPEGQVEQLDASYWPHDVPKEGTRRVPFTRTLYIERDDFMEDPPKGYYRLAPGREVRLRYGYLITCDRVEKDAEGRIVRLHCSYDPATRGGAAPDGRKVKGTLHWVSATESLPAEVRLYDRLFSAASPDTEGSDFLANLNPASKIVVEARIEPSVASDDAERRYQFERKGYFYADPVDWRADRLVYNRIVGLRDSWSRQAADKDAPAATPAPRTETAPASASDRARPEKASADYVRQRIREENPTLAAAYARYQAELGLSEEEAAILSDDPGVSAFYDAAVAASADVPAVTKWVINDMLRVAKERPLETLPFGGAEYAALVAMIEDGRVSTRIAKDVLDVMLASGGDPEQIVRERGLQPVDDEAELAGIVDAVLAGQGAMTARYRDGQKQLFGFFVGQVMKATSGRADPQLAQQLLRDRLDG